MLTAGHGAPDVLGRQQELEFLLTPEDGHTGGTPHSFVVGPAGIGRTTLLSAAARTAASRSSVRVLRADGVAAERDQPYALAHRLVSPLLTSDGSRDRAAADPEPGTFASGPEGGQAAVVLRLLRLAAESAPVLVVVDDAHLADEASQLLLAALAGENAGDVRLLLSAPGTRIPAVYGENWRSLCLGPLPPWAAARLLDSLPGAPEGRERVEILLAAAGHPLSVTELVRSSARRRDTAFPARPSASGPGEDLRATVDALPARTGSLLLHAALAADGTPRSWIDAAAGAPEGSWGAACEAELVRPRGDGYVFTHALARTAAAAVPLARRQAAHARLAAKAPAGAPQRLRHLARASLGADDALAAGLEAQAERERARGEFLDAARDFATAAERGAVAGDRARRYAAAMVCADRYGDSSWAHQLHGHSLRAGGPAVYDAHAAMALAGRQSRAGHQRQAMNTLATALAAVAPGSAEHASLTVRAAQVADESGWDAHRAVVRTAIQAASQAASPDAGPPPGTDDLTVRPGDLHALPYGLAAAVVGEPGGPPNVLAEAPPDAGPHLPAQRLVMEGTLACHLDRQDLATDRFELALREIDPLQAGGLFLDAGLPYVSALVDTGRLRAAADLARRGHELALVHGNTLATVKSAALRARALIQLGRATEGEALLADLPDLDFTENRAAQCLVVQARALFSSLSSFEDAYYQLRGLFGPDGEPLHPVRAVHAAVPLARYAQHAGRSEEAAVGVRGLRAAPISGRTTRQEALLDHAEALIHDSDGAEERFLRALKVHEEGCWPYDLGLVRHGYGAWLRRRRRTREAREVLLAAQRTFARLGSPADDALVTGELRAAGGGQADWPQGLTPQQRQVARLAADGLPNPEIARRLMLSRHTVRSHLYRVFHKLGINDRRHLPGVLPPDAPAP